MLSMTFIYLFILILNGTNNNCIQFMRDQIEQSDGGNPETARKINGNKACVSQRPEGVPNNRILVNLDLPRGQLILIWLKSSE